jgi:NADH-quinone oxidoreductase subunit E
VQDVYTYLPEDIMTYIATALGISPSNVFGVATFYAHFTMEPKGKYIIKVCDGTACHVKKSGDIIKALQKELKLTSKVHTTDDMLFTLDAVACLGVCGLAPVMLINEDIYGSLTVEKAVQIVQRVREEDANDA